MNREQIENIIMAVYKLMAYLHLYAIWISSLSDRVELEKIQTRAVMLIKGVGAIYAKSSGADQDSWEWGRNGSERGWEGGKQGLTCRRHLKSWDDAVAQ